jgi:hypothetical protein
MSRSGAAWRPVARCLTPGPVALVHEPGTLRPVACWPLSQVLHAAAMVDRCAFTRLRRGLAAYRGGAAYRALPLRGSRYYDDNAWVGLALLAVGERAAAARTAAWIAGGQDPGSGGIRWVEGGAALHACSTGAAALLALELGRDAPRGLDPPAALDFLAGLRRADGVVADHRRADGSVDEAAFCTNQGLLVALAHACGAAGIADEAAAAGEAWFTVERLWQQPVSFAAIYARCLLGAGRAGPHLREYAERLWDQGRDPAGWFTAAGRYDAGRVLDGAGAVQLYALLESAARGPAAH